MFFRTRRLFPRHRSRPAPQRASHGRKLRLEPLEDRHLLNAAPTDILLPLSTVLEQQPAGTPVGMFATVDPDLVNDFTYALVPGAGSTDNGSFTLDAMGDLLTASTFDFYTQSTYSIRVRSTDQGGLWFEKAVTVSVEQIVGRRVDLVSTALLSSTGNNKSTASNMSDDGRYVAFESSASDLVCGDTNGYSDIFIKDLVSGAIAMVSTDSSGVQSDGCSDAPCISGDGRYVAFQSSASNLVSGDTNGYSGWYTDIFVKDLASGVTTRASTDSSGVEGTSVSNTPSISNDGRYVAFESSASNLVSGDTNGYPDIFVKDMVSGDTTRVSTDSSGVQGDGLSDGPSIRGDGRYVAFRSSSSNLVPGDTNGYADVFVKDMVSGDTTRVSTDSSAVQGVIQDDTSIACINDNGRYVAFRTFTSSLVSGKTNWHSGIVVKDLVSGITTPVSTNSLGEEGNSSSAAPSISGDGRYVAFESDANNLVSGDRNSSNDIFVKDMVSGVTTRISTDKSPLNGNGDSWQPSISDDGLYVAFASKAGNLHSWDTIGADVFRAANPLANHAPTRLSLTASGVPENATSGTLVGNLRTTDIDAGETFVYTLLDDAGGRFKIVGDQVLVDNGTRLDFETAASYTIRVRATDQGGAGVSYEQDLVITVTDVYDVASIGLFDPATSFFRLRCSNTSGGADYTFGYGEAGAGWTVLSGDWNGDGQTGVGLYDPRSSTFYLSNAYETGFAEYTFGYGEPGGGWVPLVGDWNGDGQAGVGLYDPKGSTFYLTDTLQSGFAEHTFGYGEPGGGWAPLVGDWNGDRRTGVGLYDPHASTFYLTDTLKSGFAEHTFGYGEPGGGWTPLVGDWDGDGSAGVGLFAAQSSTFYLTNAFASGFAQYTFGYGEPNAGWKPLVGDWNGNGAAGVGLYAPSSSTFYLTDTLSSGYAEYTAGFGQPGAGWQPLVGCWGAAPGATATALSAEAVDQIDLAEFVAEVDRVS
jgi:hypothetical protein